MAVVAVRLVLVPISFELSFLFCNGGSKGSDDSILLGEFRFVGLKPGSRHGFKFGHALLQGRIGTLQFLKRGQQILHKLHVYRLHIANLPSLFRRL